MKENDFKKFREFVIFCGFFGFVFSAHFSMILGFLTYTGQFDKLCFGIILFMESLGAYAIFSMTRSHLKFLKILREL